VAGCCQAAAVENECNEQFMSIMQHLLVIPVIDRHGAQLVRHAADIVVHC
jgi:hypothetical protein